jgi:hypothetical protein
MQFLTNVPDLQKVCQNLDPPKKGSLLQPRKLLCGGVGYMYSGEFARASSPTPPPPPPRDSTAAFAVRLRGGRSRRLLQSSYVFGKKGFAIEFCLAKFGF